MTCDVEHTMVESKALPNPLNLLKILRVAQALKKQFSSDKTFSCQLDLKRLKLSRGSRVGTDFIPTPIETYDSQIR